MTQVFHAVASPEMAMHVHASNVVRRTLVIGLTAFLTVVDLFATQAILPSLTKAYHVTPAAMGLAVNASTLGMAIAGLAVAFFSRRIDRRLGILLSLTLLSIPTALLASAPDLTTFALLRIVQGVFMATAFALTLAYLGEACSAEDTGGAFAAYITGNVASNLIGRLISAAVADHLGLATNFYVFAALNLAGAVLVYFTISRTKPMDAVEPLRGGADGARLRVLRVPAVDLHHAGGRTIRATLRHQADVLVCARRCRHWTSALADAASVRRADRLGASRDRNVLRASHCHRIRRPRRNH